MSKHGSPGTSNSGTGMRRERKRSQGENDGNEVSTMDENEKIEVSSDEGFFAEED